MRDPRKSSRLILSIVLLATVFLDFWKYSESFYRDPDMFNVLLRGQGDAPQQYRVGVVQLARFLSQHSRLAMRHSVALIDLIGGAIAVFVLLSLLERSTIYRGATRQAQWFASLAYVFLVQFYFAWLLWYQRPETLSTAALVALMLWLLTPQIREGDHASRPAATILLVTATVAVAFLQGLVRADAAITLEFGVFALCVLNRGHGLALPRWTQAFASLLAVLVAGGVQEYLMHVVYPHATYGSTPVFELKLNLTDFMRWFPFVFFLFPFAWTVGTVARRRLRLDAPSLALIPGSLLFLGLWWMLGRVDEVRIILPFALALAPLTALLAMQSIAEDDHDATSGAANGVPQQ